VPRSRCRCSWFWYVEVDNRWTGTERFWHGGCNTETTWSDVHAGDTFIPECDAKAYINPLVS